MSIVLNGTTGVTYPAGGTDNVAGAGVGTTDSQTLTNKTLTSPTMTTPTIDSAQVPTVSGTAPLYMCRAWVNFNGTGTVAIRASGNVSSITDNATGDYTVNFTTAMPDANYGVSGAVRYGTDIASTARFLTISAAAVPTVSACRVSSAYQNGGIDDCQYVCVAIFR